MISELVLFSIDTDNAVIDGNTMSACQMVLNMCILSLLRNCSHYIIYKIRFILASVPYSIVFYD